MIAPLARASVTRLRRSPRFWVSPLLWLAFGFVASGLARARGAVHGADDVLPGVVGAFVVPLLAFAAVGAVVGDGGLRGATRGYVAIGARPRDAAVATTLVAIGLASALGALATGLGAVLAHGPSDPPLWLDAPLSLLVGALGGATYGALFCAGAAIGEGSMRGMFLALDFVFGGASGFVGALFPRGHLLALLGAEPTLDLSRRASSVALFVLGIAYVLVVMRLSQRRG